MKILLSFLLSFILVAGMAQTKIVINPPSGSKNTLTHYTDGFFTDSILLMRPVCGAPVIDMTNYRAAKRWAAQVLDTCNNLWYGYNPATDIWSIISSGGGGGIESVTGTYVDNADSLNPIVVAQTLQNAYDQSILNGQTTVQINALSNLIGLQSNNRVNITSPIIALTSNNAVSGFPIALARNSSDGRLDRIDIAVYEGPRMLTQNNALNPTASYIQAQNEDLSVRLFSSENKYQINEVEYAFPAANATGVLTNNGTGTLTWTPGGGAIRDTAKLIQQYGIYINNADSTYKPNGSDVSIAVDTAVIRQYVTNVINNDTTILNADSSEIAFFVDSILCTPPPSPADGEKYLICGAGATGVFAGKENQIVERVGGIWSYTIPDIGDIVAVSNPLQAYYKYNGTAWVFIRFTVSWGGDLLGTAGDIGNKSPNNLNLVTSGTRQLSINGAGKIRVRDFRGPTTDTSRNYVKVVDSVNGELGLGRFRQLIAGNNITITAGANETDTIAAGGGGGSVSASAGYTLHGTGTGVYQDTIIYKDTTKGWVGINRTTPQSVLDIYPYNFPGTIAVTNGSAAVTGSGTRFIDQFKNGDSILIDNITYAYVQAVTSNTTLTLTSNYTGTTNGAAVYVNVHSLNGIFQLRGNGRVYQFGKTLMYNSNGLYGNTGYGFGAFTNLTTGDGNAAFGFNSLVSNTTGGSNTAIGLSALNSNTTGGANTAVGVAAMSGNFNGEHNVGIGVAAMASIYGGFGNIGIGTEALRNVFVGNGNVGIGFSALKSTNKNNNVAIGYDAARYADPSEIVAIGSSALRDATKDSSTAIGFQAGLSSTGGSNIFIGNRAGAIQDGPASFVGSRDLIIGVNSHLNQGESGAANIFNTIFIDNNNGHDSTASTTSRVGINITNPAASAALDITSTTTGFLPPRMTATQASAISSPAEGLLVYVTDTNGTFTAKGWWGWDGAAWQKLNN